jgi:hypothetical protein
MCANIRTLTLKNLNYEKIQDWEIVGHETMFGSNNKY